MIYLPVVVWFVVTIVLVIVERVAVYRLNSNYPRVWEAVGAPPVYFHNFATLKFQFGYIMTGEFHKYDLSKNLLGLFKVYQVLLFIQFGFIALIMFLAILVSP